MCVVGWGGGGFGFGFKWRFNCSIQNRPTPSNDFILYVSCQRLLGPVAGVLLVEGEREGEFLVLFVGGSAAMCLDPSSIRSASVFGRGASARVSALVGSDPGGPTSSGARRWPWSWSSCLPKVGSWSEVCSFVLGACRCICRLPSGRPGPERGARVRNSCMALSVSVWALSVWGASVFRPSVGSSVGLLVHPPVRLALR